MLRSALHKHFDTLDGHVFGWISCLLISLALPRRGMQEKAPHSVNMFTMPSMVKFSPKCVSKPDIVCRRLSVPISNMSAM